MQKSHIERGAPEGAGCVRNVLNRKNVSSMIIGNNYSRQKLGFSKKNVVTLTFRKELLRNNPLPEGRGVFLRQPIMEERTRKTFSSLRVENPDLSGGGENKKRG